MNDEVLEHKMKAMDKKTRKKLPHSRKSIGEEGREIIYEIEKIKKELETTRSNFDTATDDILIDCYIYKIISLNKKYQYFLKLAKKSGLIAEGFEKIG